MTITIAIMAFAATTTVLAFVGMFARDLFARRRSRLERRLGLGQSEGESALDLLEQEQAEGGIDRWFFTLVEQSGSRLDRPTATALVAACAITGCALPLALWDSLFGAALGMLALTGVPILVWMFRRRRRRKSMQKHLPETLDLIADALHGGRTLEQAAEMVAAEIPGSLGQEFAFAAAQMQLGHASIAVMDRMVRRIPLAEFRILATAVLVHQRTGGNLALLAQRMAAASRDRAQFAGHLSAVSASGRLSAVGLCVGAFMALLLITWIQPGYLQKFLTHEMGPMLLVVAA
ncbi:MAG: type II secretion system F family protein, partial [Pirellulales bacterium]|nr:type II secretion system F family protein [Pirellulales bacterium]